MKGAQLTTGMVLNLICLAASLGLSASPARGADFIVDTTADTVDAIAGDTVCADAGGECSLRAAIEEANASAGADTISFDIPVSDPGYDAGTEAFTIQPSSQLPAVTDPVVIDGYTQPGASANTNPGCQQADTNGDGVVDLVDFANVQRSFTGGP